MEKNPSWGESPHWCRMEMLYLALCSMPGLAGRQGKCVVVGSAACRQLLRILLWPSKQKKASRSEMIFLAQNMLRVQDSL